jgi:phosphinothricin acetyltransferase
MPDDKALTIRPGTETDLPAINEIYNHYVQESYCTFDLEPWEISRRTAWFKAMTPPWLLFVAEQDGDILGYAYSGQFRSRPAYDRTVETTVYTRPECGRQGIGTRLMQHLLVALADHEVHLALAGVAQPNEVSVMLHKNLGYRYVGTYHEVGFKFGRYHDVAWYEYAFEDSR